MGRHQRRGHLGQTNLPSPHKHDRHVSPERGPLPHSSSPLAASPSTLVHSRKRQLRRKWRLDLAPMPRGLEALRDTKMDRIERDSPEAVLAANIEAVQHDCKSFKNESWYRSPIGPGSTSSVVLVALKQQDSHGTGFLPRSSIRNTLQHRHFQLSEGESETLLNRYDRTQDQIHYKTFVQHLHFAERPSISNENDIVFRHERYLEKVRDHATRLLENDGSRVEDGYISPLRLSPLKREMITNDEPGIVLGNAPLHSPAHQLSPLIDGKSPSPSRYDEQSDHLSFEFDKLRRAQRAQAKATKLLAHISRTDEYARQQDTVALQQDRLRIANKAFHHGEHLARVFDEEHRNLFRLENQGKALLDSPLTVAQRSVSKDSMFYVDPKDG